MDVSRATIRHHLQQQGEEHSSELNKYEPERQETYVGEIRAEERRLLTETLSSMFL